MYNQNPVYAGFFCTMSMKLCFATNNKNKLTEVQQILGDQFQVLSLSDIGCHEELPENQETLEGNSEEKARYVYDHYSIGGGALACFADDTGLEVNALKGAPGVYSARYAGPQRNIEDNIRLLMDNLSGKTDRSAQFRTVITLILAHGQQHQFEGIVKGAIALHPTGTAGFGYDSLFIPEGHKQSFAEMRLKEKNDISHRGKAVSQLVHFLKTKSFK